MCVGGLEPPQTYFYAGVLQTLEFNLYSAHTNKFGNKKA